ncbi:hypothetical protein C1S82_17880 [Mycolicibacterium cosmeticum]|uniref:hypothetical protein n=1 Tax=Mycolicibacterium cosmeticum TaxID=258533 RepID=UPI00056C261E|nr:hypothetical protein [Mycolicibacterium cosmeticum]TLH72674.1 hypothetical protein C1S82_17880 [Mycolicibacterium cosmeticum]
MDDIVRVLVDRSSVAMSDDVESHAQSWDMPSAATLRASATSVGRIKGRPVACRRAALVAAERGVVLSACITWTSHMGDTR